jgi:hypothetical protein
MGLSMGFYNRSYAELQVELRVAGEHILLNPASAATTHAVRSGVVAAAEAIESPFRMGKTT